MIIRIYESVVPAGNLASLHEASKCTPCTILAQLQMQCAEEQIWRDWKKLTACASHSQMSRYPPFISKWNSDKRRAAHFRKKAFCDRH